MKTKVDVGKILSEHAPKMICSAQEYKCLKNAMREACNQAIDLAAEEVEQYEIQQILNLKSQII